MVSYRKKVDKLKKVQTVLIIFCLVSIAVYFYFVSRPKISSYVIKDECGPIGGRISHSIPEKDLCENACFAQCNAWEKKFHSIEFALNEEQCNTCNCYCKE